MLSEKELRMWSKRVFDKFDKDNNGVLDKTELRNLIIDQANDLHIDPPSIIEIEELFEDYDENSDNRLSEVEFYNLFKVLSEIRNSE